LDTQTSSFTEFVKGAEPKLRNALISAYGRQEGWEAVAEALAYAWEHWDRIQTMDNPIGYLYRVGRSRGRWGFRRSRVVHEINPTNDSPWVEPALPAALGRLSSRQRTAVMLIKGYGWTYQEVADLTGISVSSVQNHLERALTKLRTDLEVPNRA
jgi:DNA-directed RNA polymerase specialized sigma24 family protein